MRHTLLGYITVCSEKLKAGASALMTALADTEGVSVHLRHVVRRIAQGADGVRVETDRGVFLVPDAKAVRFATLAALCRALDCQPGDPLRWEPANEAAAPRAGATPGRGTMPDFSRSTGSCDPGLSIVATSCCRSTTRIDPLG